MLRGNAEPMTLHGKLGGLVVIDKTLTIPGASADAEATGKSIKAAEKKADAAQSTADKAQKAANDARTVADSAVEDAKKAKEAADNAQTSANQAKTAVDNVKTELDTAKVTMNSVAEKLEHRGILELQATIGTDWTGIEAPYTQTIPVPGLLETDVMFVDLKDPEDYSNLEEAEYTFAQFDKFTISDNQLVVRAKEKTTMAVEVRLVAYRMGQGNDDESTYNATLLPGSTGPVVVSADGENYPMSNTELGASPSNPGKYSFEIL